nr:hypothetical protein HK105_001705 [Polyrhizophydium stewartii]
MIVARALEPAFVLFTRELAAHLIGTPRECIGLPGLAVYVEARLKSNPVFDYDAFVQRLPAAKDKLRFWTPSLCDANSDAIDFIITLGGDGTVLYAAWLFQHTQVPPVIPFHLGSLGFLTVFSITDVRSVLERVIGCSSDGVRVNMRMRLSCTVIGGIGGLYASADPALSLGSAVPEDTFQILNDLVVDRGPSAYMSQLELFVDDKHLTTVQSDGLVISTPTGSTAYSLSAGGSLVHPDVPSILMTPICAHSLSFRPMLLPDSIELKVQVPLDSRNTAWASFDGRHRIELRQGDYISVTMSRWPMPSVCMEDQSSDWFESLRRCLHWNERTRQRPLDASSLDTASAAMAGGDLPLEDVAARLFRL